MRKVEMWNTVDDDALRYAGKFAALRGRRFLLPQGRKFYKLSQCNRSLTEVSAGWLN